jgi:hypothetical protein
MHRAQRIRREALRVCVARNYALLQQQDTDNNTGPNATSTDADMV